jgi:D-alanyl-D-alanine carboxypeptidase
MTFFIFIILQFAMYQMPAQVFESPQEANLSEPIVSDQPADATVNEPLLEDTPLALTGKTIRDVQYRLRLLGYPIIVDGQLGPNTQKAIDDFSFKHNFEKNSHGLTSHAYSLLVKLSDAMIVKNPSDLFVLVNKNSFLPKDYIPENLILATVRQKYGNTQLPLGVNNALSAMFKAAEEAGHKLYLSSGYRDYRFQESLFNAQVAKVGFVEANRWVAIPGQSEHQTGLAVDLTVQAVNLELTDRFSQTQAYLWLIDNCGSYGFILRYLKGEEAVTGYSYEPWHYRYIGDPAIASSIMQRGITLEVYLQEQKVD